MRRSRLTLATSVLWRFKGTILIEVVIITIGLLTRNQTQREHQQLMNQIGMDYQFLRKGRLWPLLTGTWFQSKPGIDLSMIILVLSGTVVVEYIVGTARMLLLVVPADWTATTLSVLTLRVMSGLGSARATVLLSVPDAGTSALAHAGLGAAAVLLPPRWRRPAIAALIVYTIGQLLVESPAPIIAHYWAALYGALVGWFILRPGLKTRWHPAAAPQE